MKKRMVATIARNTSPEPMLEMNMTPLIDVMLVLIIMLIITIPKQNHSIDLTLPHGANSSDKPEVVQLDVDFDGRIAWNGVEVPTRTALESKLAAMAAAVIPPELRIRANKFVAYKYVAGVLASAKRNGVRNLSVIGNDMLL